MNREWNRIPVSPDDTARGRSRLRGGTCLRTAWLLVLLDSPRVWACATCFGAADDAQTKGMNAAILTLLAVTGMVSGTMAVIAGRILLRMRRTTQAAAASVEEAAPRDGEVDAA